MPRREPDHRARAVATSRTPPDHVFEAALWHSLRGIDPGDIVGRAIELHASEARECLRGWLLACANDDDISERTRVPTETLKAYRHLFFDVTVFRDHFDLIAWAKGLANDPRNTTEGLQYVRWAVMYGIEAVAYLSGVPVFIDARRVQEQTMIDGHFKGLMGRDAALDSPVAKEALKHQQLAVSQAAVLAKASPPSARDFAVKLKHREMTQSIEVVDKTTEVLH